MQPFAWVKKIMPITSGYEILSYSLLGLALMALISSAFVASNTIVFPPEFYGYDRVGSVSTQVFLSLIAFAGFIWHYWRFRQTSN